MKFDLLHLILIGTTTYLLIKRQENEYACKISYIEEIQKDYTLIPKGTFSGINIFPDWLPFLGQW